MHFSNKYVDIIRTFQQLSQAGEKLDNNKTRKGPIRVGAEEKVTRFSLKVNDPISWALLVSLASHGGFGGRC